MIVKMGKTWKMSRCSSSLSHNSDTLFEILLRVDPECIFEYLLVSKEWLKVITSPSFRRTYSKKWKDCNPKLVGFWVNDCIVQFSQESYGLHYQIPPAVQLLPTSKVGRFINQSKIMGDAGYFMAATSKDGLILSGISPKMYYVSNPLTQQRIRLPPPPLHFEHVSTAILSSEEEFLDICETIRNFKFIYAKATNPDHFESGRSSVSIHTFYSSTGKWNSSTLNCSTDFQLLPGGAGVARGVIYWNAISNGRGFLAAHDTKNHHENGCRIHLIEQPIREKLDSFSDLETFNARCLGIYDAASPEGFLHYAEADFKLLCIWVFDDNNLEDDEVQQKVEPSVISNSRWSLCYKIDLISMRLRNSVALKSWCIKIAPDTPFEFISFVPGRSDSIFIRWEKQFFVYHIDREKLERICFYLDEHHHPSLKLQDFWWLLRHVPLTLSGCWPSLPSSIFHEKDG
ncbi:OLC1v1014297C1 [Oldenlandia corymbosa var. corymbosa]|uniref:OLC1v1014297C1 n=1 Tax=Oldenlandia corymbosa var. corymbosa TaxID=529605 RepID=A0AAV1E3U5_OLDCO|nr:OLC1v1014297C1 [Oldenlandia corymbosa var. corymbosa]